MGVGERALIGTDQVLHASWAGPHPRACRIVIDVVRRKQRVGNPELAPVAHLVEEAAGELQVGVRH
jgi:hypothetical protein